jgi:hypothetical protein
MNLFDGIYMDDKLAIGTKNPWDLVALLASMVNGIISCTIV